MIFLVSSRFNPDEWPHLVEEDVPAPEFKETVDRCAANGIVSCCVPDDGPVIMELNRRYALRLDIPVRPPQRVELRNPEDAILVVGLSPRSAIGVRGYETATFRFRRFAKSPEV